MIGTIRKHQQWLWAIIITVTIASFVIWTGNRGSHDGGMRNTGDFGSVAGEKVTREDYERARNEALLQHLFSTGQPFRDENTRARTEMEQRIYVRLLLIQKQREMGIRVSSEKAGMVATQMIQQRFGRGGPVNLDDFKRAALDPQHLTLEDLDRFVRHELGVQEMIASVGVSGSLVTPQEAQELYRRENQEIAADVVVFSATNFVGSVVATPEAIRQFYTNQMANYRVPERHQVAFVRFPYSNYFAKVEKEITNLNERVEMAFKQLGTNTIDGAKTPQETKAKIREELLNIAASGLARNDANHFATPLFENNPPPIAEFHKMAKTNNLVVTESEPFARGDAPKGLDFGQEFAQALFSLSPTEPFSQPLRGKDAVYVLAYTRSFPPEIPSFEKIQDKVAADYKRVQAIMLARAAGMEFSKTASNGIAQGKTFDAIAAAAKVKPIQLQPISLTTHEITNHLEDVPMESLKTFVFTTPPGKTSQFHGTRDGGLVVYHRSTLPLDETRMKAELPEFTAYVRQNRQREVFDSWFRKEFEKARIDSPFLREQQEAMSKGKGA